MSPLDKTGPYVVLMRWYPGFMSAPHTYATEESLTTNGAVPRDSP